MWLVDMRVIRGIHKTHLNALRPRRDAIIGVRVTTVVLYGRCPHRPPSPGRPRTPYVVFPATGHAIPHRRDAIIGVRVTAVIPVGAMPHRPPSPGRPRTPYMVSLRQIPAIPHRRDAIIGVRVTTVIFAGAMPPSPAVTRPFRGIVNHVGALFVNHVPSPCDIRRLNGTRTPIMASLRQV